MLVLPRGVFQEAEHEEAVQMAMADGEDNEVYSEDEGDQVVVAEQGDDEEYEKLKRGLCEASSLTLTADEWRGSRALVALLRPLRKLTKVIQGDKYVTSNTGYGKLLVVRRAYGGPAATLCMSPPPTAILCVDKPALKVPGLAPGDKDIVLTMEQLPSMITIALKVIKEQMDLRFFHKPISAAKLLAMKLDPTRDEGSLLADRPKELNLLKRKYSLFYTETQMHLRASAARRSPRTSPTVTPAKKARKGPAEEEESEEEDMFRKKSAGPLSLAHTNEQQRYCCCCGVCAPHLKLQVRHFG